MREILFKAKRKDNGEWVEGFCYKALEKVYILQGETHSIIRMQEVNPTTLCQFTGLTDKNGQKIWENDIVDIFEESSKSFLRNVIKFEEGCFKVFTKCYLPMHLDNYTKSDFEVIGNIFDDADLLEV